MSGESQLEILNELGQGLHQELLAGHPTATARIVEAFINPLIDSLRKSDPGRISQYDPDLSETAVHDAILSYFQNPHQYHPEKGRGLFSYLKMSARGDLLNALTSEKKQELNIALSEIVELSSEKPEYKVEQTANKSTEEIFFERNSTLLNQAINLLSKDTDIGLLLLMLSGERKTEFFAEVLGISELTKEEQKKLVKKHKDRIKKHLQRNLEIK